MDSNKKAFINRAYGDIADMKTRFELIIKLMDHDYELNSNDKEIFYHLRRIVDKCDEISSTIEKEFKESIPAEMEI